TDLQLPASVENLRDRITATAPTNSNFIYVRADWSDPNTAAAIANATAAELIAGYPAGGTKSTGAQAFVNDQIASLQQQIRDIQSEISGLLNAATPSVLAQSQMQTLQARLTQLEGVYATLVNSNAGSGSNSLAVADPAVAPLGPSSPKPLLNIVVAVLFAL